MAHHHPLTPSGGMQRYFTTILLVISYQANGYDFKDDFSDNSNNIGNENCCPCIIQGTAGTPGIPGVPGSHGTNGNPGLPGQKGETGKSGAPGLKGDTGPVGPLGPIGKRGRKGTIGPEGPKGDTGPSGKPGHPGHTGPRGHPGTVVRPKKVAFSVIRTTKLGPVQQDTSVEFENVVTNIGQGFDEYSSHFVCRINGTYVFMTHLLGQNNQDVYGWIMLNNKHLVPLHGDGRAGHGTGSQTIILFLRYDDQVWIQISKDSSLHNDYTTFSGFLLYDD